MKYKGFLLATAGGVAAVSGAQAADLPVKAARVIPTPVATWDGWYVGLHAGAAWQRATGEYSGVVDDPAHGLSQSGNKTGFIGGGQIGYNWQRGMFVYGLEADISGLSGTVTAANLAGDTTKGNGLEARISWLSTLRGRAGWLAAPNALLYATGGLAVGGVKNTFAPNGVGQVSANPSNAIKSVSKTQVGWTIGGGLEYMVTRNWTVGLEGLYVDLGKTTGNGTNPTKTSSFKNTATIGRLKVNYRF
jgi:outer membrane immunogenic protein